MNRPYIICHMVTSVDGKVTGDFLSCPESGAAVETYYEINREYRKKGAGGFICGRVTMESSFTGGYYPDLSKYEGVEKFLGYYMNFWLDDLLEDDFFAIAFDPKGRLGWSSNRIEDDDPGYGGARIVEVLTEQVDPRYLSYLQEKEIPYFFAGETEIDVAFALKVLYGHLSPKSYLLEGGSIINGAFQRAGLIDELSLVVAPVAADKNDKPLFTDSIPASFTLKSAQPQNGTPVLNYKRVG